MSPQARAAGGIGLALPVGTLVAAAVYVFGMRRRSGPLARRPR
ncbi:hypothetical protein [Streptomyces sp. NBC_00893]|nr:hypothetical protein [Streptomyces sp. NBC_00893]MCX4850874.1 hypothetical protein [Streptomyces sp. NBC_00893]